MRALIAIVFVCTLGPQVATAQDSPDDDRDGDGIPDDHDSCPDAPEDRDGFQDTDGCPDPDNDRDGILDTKDKCPNDPETLNLFEDDDGCPDKLRSAIPPSTLQYRCGVGRPLKGIGCECPPNFVGLIQGNVAICKNKLPGATVAPPTDRDNDGIPDSRDKCPTAAETKNGFQDDDGCPDRKVAALQPGATRPPPETRPAPTGYRCGPGGKLVLGTGCTCAAGRIERRDGDGVSVCVRTPAITPRATTPRPVPRPTPAPAPAPTPRPAP